MGEETHTYLVSIQGDYAIIIMGGWSRPFAERGLLLIHGNITSFSLWGTLSNGGVSGQALSQVSIYIPSVSQATFLREMHRKNHH